MKYFLIYLIELLLGTIMAGVLSAILLCMISKVFDLGNLNNSCIFVIGALCFIISGYTSCLLLDKIVESIKG